MSAVDIIHRVPINSKNILLIGSDLDPLIQGLKQRHPAVCVASLSPKGMIQSWLQGELVFEKNSFDVVAVCDAFSMVESIDNLLDQVQLALNANGLFIVKIQNLAHWRVLHNLLQGTWRLSEGGVAHTSGFLSISQAFAILKAANLEAIDAVPLFENSMAEESKQEIQKLLKITDQVNVSHQRLEVEFAATDWIIRAGPQVEKSKNNDARRGQLCVAAVAMKKFAGVTEARVDFPLAALRTLPNVRVTWSEGMLTIPKDYQPGIIILHRQFMNDTNFIAGIEQKVREGWLLVSDIDDDPHHWKEFIESDFYAYRAVHAVTVSCEELAGMVLQWNPHVQIFQNAIYATPLARLKNLEQQNSGLIRIFFGALNRKEDWLVAMPGILKAASYLNGQIEFIVVHDKEFFEALPSFCKKQYFPTLAQHQYMATLASCNIALLPLNDNNFNRCKSDIKLIECAAAGVAVICSSVVYAQDTKHANFVLFADTAEDWFNTILELCENTNRRNDNIEQASLYVQEFRMHSHQVGARYDFYQSLLEKRNELEGERQMRLKKLQNKSTSL